MRGVLDLSAPIVPGKGLAGLEIGRHVVEYADLLVEAETNIEWWADEDESARESWKSIFSLWEARFRFPQVYEWTEDEFVEQTARMEARAARLRAGLQAEDLWVPERPPRGPDAVEIAVDLRDGHVFALRALAGYSGDLFGSIRVGMSGREAQQAEPRLRYAEQQGGLVIDGVLGLLLALAPYGYDLEDEHVAMSTIDEIWVFERSRAEDGVLATWPPEIT